MQQFSRTDSQKFEPMRMSPAFGQADIILLSPRRNATNYRTNLIEVVYKFDDLIYFYSMICLFVVITLLVSIWYCELSNAVTIKRQYRKIGKKVIKCLWSIYETVTGQNTYDPSSWSNRILWLFVMMAILLAIIAVLLNLMSTDQVAQIQARRINSLEDLLSPDFHHYQPSVVKVLYLYSLVVTAASETKLVKLFSRIQRNDNIGVLTMNGSNIADFFKILTVISDSVAGSNLSLLGNRFMNRHYVSPMLCSFKPKLVSGTYESKEGFAEGILVGFLSKYMDSGLADYLRYQFMTSNEVGFSKFALKDVAVAIIDKCGFEGVVGETIMCNSGYRGEDDYEQAIDDILLQPSALKGTVIVCCVMLSLASFVLIIELSVFGLKLLSKNHRLNYLRRQISAYLWYNFVHQLRLCFLAVFKLWHLGCKSIIH